jgi:N-methylhydantoinase B
MLNLRGPMPGGDGSRRFSMVVTSNGGTGARPDKDGLSATAYPSGVRGTPIEIAESMLPVIFWRKELRPDSGGAGRTRGGLGQEIEVESAAGLPFQLLAAFDRIDHPPRGRDGGADGARGYLGLAAGGKLKGKGFQTIPPGDRLVIRTPGGAGIGPAAQRSPDALAGDLRDGLVSPEAANSQYGTRGTAAE